MVGVVFVITDLIFGLSAAVIVTVVLALSFSLLWFALPLRYRGNGGGEEALHIKGRLHRRCTKKPL